MSGTRNEIEQQVREELQQQVRHDELLSALSRDITQFRSIVLDSVERLAVLETSSRFADEQRQFLIENTSTISARLGEISGFIKGYDTLARDFLELKRRVDVYDTLWAEKRGQLTGAKWAWSIIWAAIGFSVATALAWLKLRQGG